MQGFLNSCLLWAISPLWWVELELKKMLDWFSFIYATCCKISMLFHLSACHPHPHHSNTHTHTNAHTNTPTHTHTHTNTHTHTHTHTHTPQCLFHIHKNNYHCGVPVRARLTPNRREGNGVSLFMLMVARKPGRWPLRAPTKNSLRTEKQSYSFW